MALAVLTAPRPTIALKRSSNWGVVNRSDETVSDYALNLFFTDVGA
jgi:hypothetical protein